MYADDPSGATPEQCLHFIFDAVKSLRGGYLTARLSEQMPGDAGRIAKVFNELVDLLLVLRSEHHRLMEEVGVTGRLGGQMEVPEPTGAWRELVDDVNLMSYNMTDQQRQVHAVIRGYLRGETQLRMTKRIIVGEIGQVHDTLNELLDRFSAAKSPS